MFYFQMHFIGAFDFTRYCTKMIKLRNTDKQVSRHKQAQSPKFCILFLSDGNDDFRFYIHGFLRNTDDVNRATMTTADLLLDCITVT